MSTASKPPSGIRRAARAAAFLWTAAIFLLCLWPGDALPKTQVPLADKWTHLILFGGFSLLWLMSLPRPGARAAIGVMLIAAALGWFVECLQGWLPALHRSRDWMDAVADALGGLLGGGAYLLAAALRSPRTDKARGY